MNIAHGNHVPLSATITATLVATLLSTPSIASEPAPGAPHAAPIDTHDAERGPYVTSEVQCTMDEFLKIYRHEAIFLGRVRSCADYFARQTQPPIATTCPEADSDGHSVLRNRVGLCVCSDSGTLLLGGRTCASLPTHLALLRYRNALDAVDSPDDMAPLDEHRKFAASAIAALPPGAEKTDASAELNALERLEERATKRMRGFLKEICPRMRDERGLEREEELDDCGFRFEHNRFVFEVGMSAGPELEKSAVSIVGGELLASASYPVLCPHAFCHVVVGVGAGYGYNLHHVGSLATVRGSVGWKLMLTPLVQVGANFDAVQFLLPMKNFGTSRHVQRDLMIGPSLPIAFCPGGGDYCAELSPFVRFGSATEGEKLDGSDEYELKTNNRAVSYGFDLGFTIHL